MKVIIQYDNGGVSEIKDVVAIDYYTKEEVKQSLVRKGCNLTDSDFNKVCDAVTDFCFDLENHPTPEEFDDIVSDALAEL